jgi:SRSO17 transposase
LIDRELYLPEKWVSDRDRCKAAGIGDSVGFATKPELARRMIERAAAARVPFSWVVGDEVYGGNPQLRGWLEEQAIPYVMAVARSEIIPSAAGGIRADELAALVPAGSWQRLSCADGSKGPRLYDWALIGTDSPQHRLLVRRSLAPGEKGTVELAFFRCWSPRPVTLSELTAVAGARWEIEDCFGEAKNEVGLDRYQVRRYRAWYRHATLSMLAHAFLTVAARASRTDTQPPPGPGPVGDDERATAKKGTSPLWTAVRSSSGIHPASLHNGR